MGLFDFLRDFLDGLDYRGFLSEQRGDRLRFYSSLGSVGDKIQTPTGHIDEVSTRWSEERGGRPIQAQWRSIRTGTSTIIATDFLSDPIHDPQDQERNAGIGLEIVAETPGQLSEDVHSSWLFQLVFELSRDGGRLRNLAQTFYEHSSITKAVACELTLDHDSLAPLSNDDGKVGVLLSQMLPQGPRYKTEGGYVEVITAKLLTPLELEFALQGRTRALADHFTQARQHHLSVLSRKSVVEKRGSGYKDLDFVSVRINGHDVLAGTCERCGCSEEAITAFGWSCNDESGAPERTTAAYDDGGLKDAPSGGFFVFDHSDMDSMYGKQAFQAIRKGLLTSSGTCVFCEGDISQRVAAELCEQAAAVTTAGTTSVLSDPGSALGIGPYVAAMWTDSGINFERLHAHLVKDRAPGYAGMILMKGRHSRADFLEAVTDQLMLPTGLVFVNGEVLPHTSRYGIR